jgi:glycosyltransferase involved in cell wall biosynthesis
MLISVGILAWNEAAAIEPTLVSLFKQTALRQPGVDMPRHTWEVIVVPNGCSDETAAVARRVLAQQVSLTGRSDISWAVHELTEPGKSNAWNHFIHRFSSREAEFILMLDADIEFGQPETVSNTITALSADSLAVAAVDLPLKDAHKKTRKSLIERISIAASNTSASNPVGLSGQFFCARADALRRIWMPKGLSVEDGFLGAMLCSDCLLAPLDPRKLIRAPNADHYYETLTNLHAIFRHELRLVIGSTLNCYLIWDFLLFAVDPRGGGAGELIRNQLERDPNWYSNLITNSIRNHGWWVLPRGTLLRRFSGYRMHRGVRFVRWFTIAVVGFMLDLPVFLVANRRIKNTNAIGYW